MKEGNYGKKKIERGNNSKVQQTTVQISNKIKKGKIYSFISFNSTLICVVFFFIFFFLETNLRDLPHHRSRNSRNRLNELK